MFIALTTVTFWSRTVVEMVEVVEVVEVVGGLWEIWMKLIK